MRKLRAFNMPYRYLTYSAICERAPIADYIKYPYVRPILTCLLDKIRQNMEKYRRTEGYYKKEKYVSNGADNTPLRSFDACCHW